MVSVHCRCCTIIRLTTTGSILTRIRAALVDVRLAVCALITSHTRAAVGVYSISAECTVLTRIRAAIVNIRLAVCAIVTSHTRTVVSVQIGCTTRGSVLTRIRATLVNVLTNRVWSCCRSKPSSTSLTICVRRSWVKNWVKPDAYNLLVFSARLSNTNSVSSRRSLNPRTSNAVCRASVRRVKIEVKSISNNSKSSRTNLIRTNSVVRC